MGKFTQSRNRRRRGDDEEALQSLRSQGGGVDMYEYKQLCPSLTEALYIDQFAYVPQYRFHAYRSYFGAFCTMAFAFVFLLRMVSSTLTFIDTPPYVVNSPEQFSRDSDSKYELPRFGVQFRKDGWEPFSDPRYVSITFDQGVIHRSGNVSYVNLGSKSCAFIDETGRLIADEALCPDASGMYMQGDFHDVTFGFVRARLLRCNNGTDAEGKPVPGICHPPAEIDKLVYQGVLYMFQEEVDMSLRDDNEFMRIRQWRREFVTNVHISTDVFFTVKEVTLEPRYIFDKYSSDFISGRIYVVRDDDQETYTSFDELTAQYAAFYFRLGSIMHKQRRSYSSLYSLFEKWGAIGAYLYFTLGFLSKLYNQFRFDKQVKGLDLRKLDKEQFTRFGRLIDKSFQMPREFQAMRAD